MKMYSVQYSFLFCSFDQQFTPQTFGHDGSVDVEENDGRFI